LLSAEGVDSCPWNWQDIEEVLEDDAFTLETLHETLLRVNLAFVQKAWPHRWRDIFEMRVIFHDN
jgi:hypothetical protein